jgi:hypothetical protein
MTWRSLIGQGRGHVSDVIQILQSDWAAQVTGFLLFSESLSGLPKGAFCFPPDVFFVLSIVSISAYLTRLLSPAYQSGLLYIFCF